MEAYDNIPGSGVFMLGIYSKREYIYLTEEGYRRAKQERTPVTPPRHTSVNITGSQFHNSPVGVGGQVAQTLNIGIESRQEIVDYLRNLLQENGHQVDEQSERDLVALADAALDADSAKVKPIFQQVFGVAAEGVKQVAWSLLTVAITKAMGL